MKRLFRRASRLALPALATLAFFCGAPAHAVGRLADLNVIDRETGATLSVYRHRGEYWVAGRPGARYAVSVRNATSGRVLSVISVDGVNVVSGETASWEQTGYVLSPWQATDITGWRKSDAEVAAFHFTASQASYAARTGRPDNVGVIGVAVFREKLPPPVAVPYSQPRIMPESGESAAAQGRSAAAGPAPADKAAPAPGLGAAGALSESADAASARSRDESLASGNVARPAPAPRLGTGHGEREASRVGHTAFERNSSRPDEVLRIRYDSRENLIAMGVIPGAAPQPLPNPFPEAPLSRYVPDPPSYR
jgi:hypothetical protein